jgi:mRNA turnover protein 4
LTKTAKKTRDHKSSVIREVRDAIDNHDILYLFSYENMRSNKFKKLRLHFREPDMEGKSSRIFLGKNKLLQIALGRTPEEEYADNLRHVSKLTSGSVGLLFTSRPSTEVEQYFEDLVEEDFARAGSVAPRQVAVTNDMVATHPVSMVEQFRKLGLPVEVQNGRLALIGGTNEYIVCKAGETLSAEACKSLVHFGIKLAEFRLKLICKWSSAEGEFEMLN